MSDKGYSTIQLLDDGDSDSEEELLDTGKNFDFTKPTNETMSGSIAAPESSPAAGNIDDDDEDDKTELLSSSRKSPSFWTFEYYQTFFDVDTDQVISRMLGTMIPSKQNYLLSKIRPNPDLYGPFWICATLVFTIAICGNLSNFFASQGQHKWHSNFQLVSLSACVIYGYAWIVPAVLWAYLLWRGNLAGYSFLEIVCVYGYSLAIFIPISILWLAHWEWLRWILVLVGVCLSGWCLTGTFWPAVEDDSRKYAYATIGVIVLLHFVLALGFKLYFFKTIHIHVHETPVPAPSVATVAVVKKMVSLVNGTSSV